MKPAFKIALSFLLFALVACNRNPAHQLVKSPIIEIQPFEGISPETIHYIQSELHKVYPYINVKTAISPPAESYNKQRNRYRADSLIAFLSRKTPKGHITIGLAHFDISTTKGKVKDWGVMGLGYRPGNSCIASTFRLSNKNRHEQFFKVVIHELGHTQNLPHCPIKTCFMRDAEGGNPTNEEKEFCENCRRKLKSNGWKI